MDLYYIVCRKNTTTTYQETGELLTKIKHKRMTNLYLILTEKEVCFGVSFQENSFISINIDCPNCQSNFLQLFSIPTDLGLIFCVIASSQLVLSGPTLPLPVTVVQLKGYKTKTLKINLLSETKDQQPSLAER